MEPMRFWTRSLLLVPTLAAACGGSPSTPTLLAGAGSSPGEVSGTVIKYQDGTPMAGVTVTSGGRAARTDAQGRFTLAGLGDSGTATLTANPAGYLFRGVNVALAAARSGLTLDLLQDAPPFSLSFYREFVRDATESLALSPTAPWTMNPSFYVKRTVDGTSNYRVNDDVIDRIRDVIAGSIPELSGGRLRLAAFERGDDPRPAADGWVNLTFFEQGDTFGRSSVGGNSGTMFIRYFLSSNPNTNPYNCYTPEVQVVDHEITHTMGYWHTSNTFADTFSGEGCPGSGRPDYVRYHAKVMYSRPKGNRDPDIDPADAIFASAPAPLERWLVDCPARVFVR